MGELIQLSQALSGMGAFGKSLGLVLALAAAVFALRRGRNEEEDKRRRSLAEEEERRAQRQAKTLDDLQEDYNLERARRIDADQKVSRYLEALRVWCGFAHEQRHARMNDRQRHVSYEQARGIEPLMLPEVGPLPRLVEDEEG